MLAALIICGQAHAATSITAPPPLANSKTQKAGSIAQHKQHRITLNFSNIRTRELLQVIAQFTGLNFVISDTVKGRMSIHLQNVPWWQALHVILKAHGLGERKIGNIVYVAPIQELAQQEITALQTEQQLTQLEPLRNRIIRFRYANAEEMAKLLNGSNSSLVSARGSVSVDQRTNSMWIRDTASSISSVAHLLRSLDHPVKQVMIETRVINIQRPYEQQLGARFGVTAPDHLSGTLGGANQIAQGVKPAFVKPFTDRLNFNIPAKAIMGATPGSIGLAVARLGKTFIDMELSALEREGHVDLISSPRLVTTNQHTAYIKVGEEIPYQVASASGATAIEFKDAVLELQVTPQITSDNRIVLNIKVSNNRAGQPVKVGLGEAIPIETEEEASSILVNDHQTIVIGGVYKQDKRKIITRIPFLGRIPIIGRLFSNHEEVDDQAELLIFLTPHIIHKPSQLNE